MSSNLTTLPSNTTAGGKAISNRYVICTMTIPGSTEPTSVAQPPSLSGNSSTAVIALSATLGFTFFLMVILILFGFVYHKRKMKEKDDLIGSLDSIEKQVSAEDMTDKLDDQRSSTGGSFKGDQHSNVYMKPHQVMNDRAMLHPGYYVNSNSYMSNNKRPNKGGMFDSRNSFGGISPLPSFIREGENHSTSRRDFNETSASNASPSAFQIPSFTLPNQGEMDPTKIPSFTINIVSPPKRKNKMNRRGRKNRSRRKFLSDR